MVGDLLAPKDTPAVLAHYSVPIGTGHGQVECIRDTYSFLTEYEPWW